MSAAAWVPCCELDGDEGRHDFECPIRQREERYWSHHFGQDYGTKEEKRARLAAMRPGGPTDEEIQDMRDAGRMP